VEGLVTTTKVRVLAGQQFANRQQVIRIDYEPRATIGATIEAELIDPITSKAAIADGIVLSDYGYGIATPAIFAAVKDAAAKNGIPLIVDSRFSLSKFPGATSATPNEEEAEQFLGNKFTPGTAERLRTELGVESLLVTRGNKGMVLAEAGRITEIEAIGSKEPVDVTGAGDTVIAAYSLGLASGFSHIEAARISNHAGSIVVMKKGTATASADELTASLKREKPETTTTTA
jgi:rfaE bifunctional protein kinase chain/domain